MRNLKIIFEDKISLSDLIALGLSRRLEGSFVIKGFSIRLIDFSEVNNSTKLDEESLIKEMAIKNNVQIELEWKKRNIRVLKCNKIED